MANYHIPWLIWLVLFGVTILSMIKVGYLFGGTGQTKQAFIIALALAFSGVMILIVDLDRSGTGATGVIQVNQQPMTDLQRRLYGAAAKIGIIIQTSTSAFLIAKFPSRKSTMHRRNKNWRS